MESFYSMNQTRLETSELHVIPDMLPNKAQDIVRQYRGAFELFVMFPLYMMFYSSTRQYVRGFPVSKKGKVIGFPPRVLCAHIVVSLTSMARFYYRNLFAEPSADVYDLALGLAQVSTAWLMCKWTPSKSPLAKASFQTMAMMFLIPIITAYVTTSTRWHRTTVKCIEWFVIYRWVAVAIQKYKIYGVPKVDGDAIVHLVSVPLTLWLANWMWAIPLYLFATPTLINLEHWVTAQIPHNQAKRTGLAGLLAIAGFCQLPTNKPPVVEGAKPEKERAFSDYSY